MIQPVRGTHAEERNLTSRGTRVAEIRHKTDGWASQAPARRGAGHGLAGWGEANESEPFVHIGCVPMPGAAVSTHATRLPRPHPAGPVPTVLHLAVTSSAAARLAPVAASQPGRQLLLDRAGRLATWLGTEPLDARCRKLAPAAVAKLVTAAIERARPEVALVAGDDDAVLAGTLAAVQAGVPIARVGAGLRCRDRSLGREINRLAIDELAERLYTDSEAADEQLRAEGADERKLCRVGSTLPALIALWREAALELRAWTGVGLEPGEYVLVSLRREESFTDLDRLATTLGSLAERHRVVLCLDEPRPLDLNLLASAVVLGEPLSYVEFLSLEIAAGAVLTDSAGVQEETTVLGVPCFTLADASERTTTLACGTNTLLGEDPAAIADVTITELGHNGDSPPLWDGEAGRRIAADLLAAPWEQP